MENRKFFVYSNEIVFRGHPDKVADQIAGALLKEYLLRDENSHCGIEVLGGKGKVFISGEVTSNAIVNVELVAKRVLKDCGYDSDKYEIVDNIGKQSLDINQGVSLEDGDIGAGDQGMMFGFACNDTPELLRTAQVILQKFAKEYDELRQKDRRFLPDGKAQITGIYDEDFNLISIKDFTISYQNTEEERAETDKLIKIIASGICDEYQINIEQFHINPTGKFLVGGFDGDAGLTGRKIVVDAYQSFANVGGGNMNGKDPSKVDFSAAHKARELAKRFLKDKKLNWCEVQISYAIGETLPLAIYVRSNEGLITDIEKEIYEECKPKQIINDLELLHRDFEELAKFGHFED